MYQNYIILYSNYQVDNLLSISKNYINKYISSSNNNIYIIVVKYCRCKKNWWIIFIN